MSSRVTCSRCGESWQSHYHPDFLKYKNGPFGTFGLVADHLPHVPGIHAPRDGDSVEPQPEREPVPDCPHEHASRLRPLYVDGHPLYKCDDCGVRFVYEAGEPSYKGLVPLRSRDA